MAKAKKKETLTPEERLQAVLVPDWEQPYISDSKSHL